MGARSMLRPVKGSASGYTFVQVLVALVSLALMAWISFVLQRYTHWHYAINFGIILAAVFLLLKWLDRRPVATTDPRLEQTLHHAQNMAISVEGILQQISGLPEIPPELDLFVPDKLTLAGAAVPVEQAVERIRTRLAGKGLVLTETVEKSDGRLCHFVRKGGES